MSRRRRDAPLRGITFACATAILVIAIPSQTKAAETEFGYATSVSETYNGDVLRIGTGYCDAVNLVCIGGDNNGATCATDAECASNAQSQSDFITTLALPVSLNWRTPRSVSVINYVPEYLKFARFDELDGLNHRLTSGWDMTPGPRSAVGVRVGYLQTNQQSGFQSSPGVGGAANDPIVQLTRRVSWDIDPYHRINIGRTWSMETRAIFRSQQFDSPNLTDVATAGLIYSFDARVRGARRIGGRVRYGRNFFDRTTSTTTAGEARDEVVNVEAIWSQEEGDVFRWNTGLGFFKVVGDDQPPYGAPTFNASANWDLVVSSIQAGYRLGFSTVAGSVGTARSESASFAYSHRWGRGFTGAATANFVRFQSLADDRFLDGYSFDLQAAYNWQRHWGLSFKATHLVQEQTTGRSLNYILATIGVTFTPDRPSRGRSRP